MNKKHVIFTTLGLIVAAFVVGGFITSFVNSLYVTPTITNEDSVVNEAPLNEDDFYDNLEGELPEVRELQELGHNTKDLVEKGKDYTIEHSPEWIEKGKDAVDKGVDYVKEYGPGTLENLKDMAVNAKDNFETWAKD